MFKLLVAAIGEQREPAVLSRRRVLPAGEPALLLFSRPILELVARAEVSIPRLGSMFDPETLKKLIRGLEHSLALAVLCLAHVAQFYRNPMPAPQTGADRNEFGTRLLETVWSSLCR